MLFMIIVIINKNFSLFKVMFKTELLDETICYGCVSVFFALTIIFPNKQFNKTRLL